MLLFVGLMLLVLGLIAFGLIWWGNKHPYK